MFDGKEAQFIFFHRCRHVLQGRPSNRAGPKIQKKSEHEFYVHNYDKENTKPTQLWADGFIACPSGAGDDDRGERGSQNDPANETMQAQKLGVEI